MAGRLKPRAAPRTLPDFSHGPLLPPLRTAGPAPDNWDQAGEHVAFEHGPAAEHPRAPAFHPRLRENTAALHDAHRCIARQAGRGHPVGAAGEWLLDNIHLLAAQTREVHDGLPRRFYRRLPVLAGPALDGLPRVYGIAWAYVTLADSLFDPVALVAFLEGYQAAQSLTLGELWAIPTTLRVVLIENLRRLAERVAAEESACEAADALCDDAARAGLVRAADAAQAFEHVRRHGVGTAFALRVMERLHGDSEAGRPGADTSREAIRAALAAALPDPPAALREQQARLVADGHSVAQAVRALQALGGADWRGIVASASPTMRCLLGSPLFALERSDTQDATLHDIERLARRCGRDESEVATTLLALMRSPPRADALGPGAPVEAAGYWTRGPGRATLHAALGLPVHRGPLAAVDWQRWAVPLYLGGLATASGLLTLAVVALALAPGASALAWVLCAGLAWWPASEVVAATVQRLVSEWVPPRRPARLAFDDGLPAAHRVLVVVPTILADEAGVQRVLERLEQHHLANREPWAQFALLSDWADADQAEHEGDATLLTAAVAGVETLQARHGPGAEGARRFLLLHRRRRWSDSEQRWIGWERKRGKLEALVALLADARAASPFVDLGKLSRPRPGTPYVVTLDSDTVLPPGTLRALVGVAAHPLNRPRIDACRRRVVAGHAILQPRVDVAWPVRGEVTPYHRLFAGRSGHDPYDAAPSECYGDLFDEASFSGKGLLHVAAVHAVLGGRLPEQQVLSHDLVEGAIARCGGVGDVPFAEPAPTQPDAAAARLHRWTRGDWQLLPLLLRPRRYALRAIDVWKMLDNLRRPLVAPLSLLWLGLALAGAPFSAGAALGLMVAAWGCGPLLGALAGLGPSRDDISLRHFGRGALAELGLALGACVWQVALWPRQAALNLGAIGLALWRTGISRRHLLQWTTAEASHHAAVARRRGRWPRHLAVTAFTVGAAWMLLAAGTPHPELVVILALMWAGTPWWIAWAGQAHNVPVFAPTATDGLYLRGVAHDTWRFFEQQVGAHSRHLPPDNVQTVPHTIVAQRTSPTNIGLYMLSLACARAWGWLGRADMLARCESTLDTLDRLPRHRGHFLNWIDTQSLATLPPAYVSTVDSGNLCVLLVALASACDAEAVQAIQDGHGTAAEDAARLARVAARCRALAEAPEFGFLFDARRRLLHIGWRVEEGRPDAGFYDLLASESRLASLWAIAKGDVPATHWAALGRPFQAAGREVGLRSWSGSMFEYLMPTLLLDEPEGSALERAARMAMHEQQVFGAAHGKPWGVSECAHAAVDAAWAYQYGPHGVPRLALRRTPPAEFVVAPYASALAALIDPHAAVANLRRLEALGARGPWGFIEALDFTPQRQSGRRRFTRVDTTMAHHQGMTLVALTQVLLDGLPRRWAMADPRLAAVASLLHERVPREVARVPTPLSAGAPSGGSTLAATGSHAWPPGAQALPPTKLLSNGRYTVALRPNGAGWSRHRGVDLTRWRDDALRDAHGSFVFVRRASAETPASVTLHPAPDPAAHYAARFEADRACFEAHWPDLRVRSTVQVAADEDVELRHVELWNLSTRPLPLELLSMFEPCLAEARADEMHQAFANLFLSADWDAALQALAFMRRPRREEEPARHAAHFIVRADDGVSAPLAQADRARWRGRLRGGWQPVARFAEGDAASGPRPTGLDPVAALSMQLTLPPHGTAQLTLGTAVAPDRASLRDVVLRCRAAGAALNIGRAMPPPAGLPPPSAPDREAIQLLTTTLVLLLARPAGSGPPGPAADSRSLWRLGLSGERPVISVGIAHARGLPLVRALVHALVGWAAAGVDCDLVVLDAEPRSYLRPLHQELERLRESTAPGTSTPPPRAADVRCHLWQSDDLSDAERSALAQLARVRLHADGRPLAHHVAELVAWHEAAQAERDGKDHVVPEDTGADPPDDAAPWPGPRGHFDAENGRFGFAPSRAQPTPRPWVNVLANPSFGALVSEAGGGCTWAGNSRLHQLTPGSNDLLEDMPGEAFYVQDTSSRAAWQIGRGPAAGQAPRRVEHGPGSTTIRQRDAGLEVIATWCVDGADAIKRVHIELVNHGTRALTLRVIGVFEWQLGMLLADRRAVRTWHEGGADAGECLFATQDDGRGDSGGHTAFLALTSASPVEPGLEDWTCDRRELFDARGRRVLPDHLGQRAGAGLDPCAAASVTLRLAAGESAGCVFAVGHASSAAAARELAARQAAADARAAERAVRERWAELLGAVRVRTPDPLFDALVNHWLPYQVVACRLWARAGPYQAGGAYGFRDQLQDAMALAITAPQLLRDHLLRAAARQFVEGDVQHWWHPATGAGVRTHFSDDRLWLPHAVHHYVQASADLAVLEEDLAFLEGPALAADTEDAYFTPSVSRHTGTLYEHCARAIDRSLAVGAHGLPLMGGGDWNDGMNRVGPLGRGESVWLGWFLWRVVSDFAPLAETRGGAERERAGRWRTAADGWRRGLLRSGWDGDWFVRAFFDDGSPLGSQRNAECRIDLIAQAWSVLSGAAPESLQRRALASAVRWLADESQGLWRLLDPPLATSQPAAGYIQAYPAGVRENGSQYAHAVVWAAMAQAALGDADGAWRTWTWLSPAHRSADPQRGPRYGLEPYAMAADIYTHPPYAGRGGWSWYTGSAAGMYRLALERICGLQWRGSALRLQPRLPGHWSAVTLTVRHARGHLELTLCADGAADDIAQARARGARPLAEGEWLALADAPASGHCLVVCAASRGPTRPCPPSRSCSSRGDRR